VTNIEREACVTLAKAMWAEGALPSEIFQAVVRRLTTTLSNAYSPKYAAVSPGPMELIMIGHDAFGVGVFELEAAMQHLDWPNRAPAATFDAYLLPLIERSSPR
jgi:hypothetical protein